VTKRKKAPAREIDPEDAGKVRLQKILAAAGIASRRKAEEYILEGRVVVNGQIVTEIGTKADPAKDHIKVDGKLLKGPERPRYFVLNKPKGMVTTLSDPQHRPTVGQILSSVRERLYPVGRLDYNSEGLLIMTNDGDLANGLMRAASGVEKVYIVKIAGRPTNEAVEKLAEGVRIDRGIIGEGKVLTAPSGVRLFRDGENPWYEVTLVEGRNRQIRKMFEEVGHHVEKIRRIAYGPLKLDVEPGEFRELTDLEVENLRRATKGYKPVKLPPKDHRARFQRQK
jgi:23S rRNA pseudouridine2605 synthase